ncbi:hypothetical protein [Frankia sp. EAN1pec]|uniref:hypothetical protein n=1 Tax=Parafrankia sp. (strain EAN1pec) TaxID=298653 RepID=UPI00059CC37D
MTEPLGHERQVDPLGKLDARAGVPQIVEPPTGEQVPAELGPDLDVDRQRLGQVQPDPAAAHPGHRGDRHVAHRLTVHVQRPGTDRVRVPGADVQRRRLRRRRDPHRGAQPGLSGDLLHPRRHPHRSQVPPVGPGEHQVLELDGPTVLVG